ncbi:MAG: carbon-nitrogen hydrolase family protein [Phycisphaerae bacterium]|nr:carbon-nitrogen hydrolase family protein [Gemmatimonadaceae bacterium]
MAKSVRVSVVQAEVSRTLQEGLDRTAALAAECGERGADLVVFPETWLPGYPVWLDVCRDVALWDSAAVKAVYERHADNSVDVDGVSGAMLGRIARESGVTMVLGVTERIARGVGRGTLYNALLTYGPDGVLLNHHRKLVPTYTERMVWGHGDANGLRAVDTPAGRIGGLVCWEHWMPLSRQALHESGEDIHVAAWPTVHEMNQITCRQYAFEGRCFVLAAGSLMRASELPSELETHADRVADAGSWVMRGGSCIIAPNGQYVVPPVFEAHALLHAELDLGMVRREHMSLDVAGHYSRPDIFNFSVNSGRK